MHALWYLSIASLYGSACALQIPFSSTARDVNDAPEKPLQQPDSSPPTDWPYRELPWGEVNILSTTDTHGWLLGHQRNEPNFSGDWGDLYSFVTQLKAEARRRGVDLLLVDSGDRVDGNGLVDAEPPPSAKGATALSFFTEMPYDIVTTGNHELYRYPVAKYAREVLYKSFEDRWVVSNVNISLAADGEVSQSDVVRPFGNRLRKFKTEMGRKVTAFGPLFDFKAHAPGISVQKPSEMVKEEWFVDAIRDRPDFFLFVGHMSVRIEPDSEWRTLIAAIRRLHPTTPVLVFGGHHHIRDCVQEDKYSMSLAAGRYMETIGFASVSGMNHETQRPRFARRYIDQNRNSYAYHSGTSDFDTEKGRSITARLVETAKRFNLTDLYGTAPQDYFLHRYPATSNSSIFHLLTTEVLPTLIRRDDRPFEPFTILNTGSVRFDLFKGPFTRNDQWILLPFPNNFLFVPRVPIRIASKLIPYLNLVGEHGLLPTQQLFSPRSPTSDRVDGHFEPQNSTTLFSTPEELIAAESAHLEHVRRRALLSTSELTSQFSDEASEALANEGGDGGKWRMKRPSEGYVTLDSCNDLGDDILHTPYKVARQPVFVSTHLPPPRSPRRTSLNDENLKEDEGFVDVVFFDFIKPDILSALNWLSQPSSQDQDGSSASIDSQERKEKWGDEDVGKYMDDLTANTLLETWAKRAWKK